MMNVTCIPCQHGNCENCQGGMAAPPGMFGGWKCVCKGDCKELPEHAALRQSMVDAMRADDDGMTSGAGWPD